MKNIHVKGVFGLLFLAFIGAMLPRTGAEGNDVSYKKDVVPILEKYCLPCHAEENFNKSELSLDSYELLMKGGEHGEAVIAGDPDKSNLIQKLSKTPPFGDRMPFYSKRKKKTTPPVYLSTGEVKVLSNWISQGAKNN